MGSGAVQCPASHFFVTCVFPNNWLIVRVLCRFRGMLSLVFLTVFMQPLIRFREFELNVRSGELLRQGSRVKLQNQPFQILAMLLENPGEVVTREELRKRLWPENTFVDFDRGLNKAISGLRWTLKDRVSKPLYIETVPHRGYRFIAKVADPVSSPPALRVDSLAVLPLENLSGDPAQEYFADGMTEELICAVARIASLRVISRTSVMTFKGARRSVPDIAKELHVDAILEGTVARSGEKVRITAQLIYAAEDRHLWSGRYERDLSDILQLQTDLAQSIASQIHKVVDPERAARRVEMPVNSQAYEACLKGNYFRDKMTPDDLRKSVAFFTQAIELDPGYARAYADLSQSYVFLGIFGVARPREVFLKARSNALKALELDDASAAAHNALALIHILYDWDWASAEAECRRAVDLNPQASVTYAHFADYLSIRGRHDEAIAAFARALELDPISRVFKGHFGLILHRARRYDESIAQCRGALEIDPTYANALWFMALSLEQQGELAEAVATLQRAVSLSKGPHFRALLGRAYALSGDRTKALEILNELQELSGRMYVSAFDLAVVHAGLDDRNSAFQFLEEAYQQRVFRIIELILPMFDDLRPDPRWGDLVRRIGLPNG